MISKWYDLKLKALEMRKNGHSLRAIAMKLKIPRSTLSGWFKNIELTEDQKVKLNNNWKNALNKARVKAVAWHNKQKEIRINIANDESNKILNKINTNDKYVLELALAMLYLGEGDKTQQTSMGSTNPIFLRFFIKSLNIIFHINSDQIKCDLHLRSDQDEKQMIRYWSSQLKLPINKFTFTKDKRTIKSKTYPNYMGVCVARCGHIAIQRRLVLLGQKYSKIVSEGK